MQDVSGVDQHLVQIAIALEHVAIFGGDLLGLYIGQAGPVFPRQLLRRRDAAAPDCCLTGKLRQSGRLREGSRGRDDLRRPGPGAATSPGSAHADLGQ